MKTRENRVWAWLSKARLVLRQHLDIERVENSIGAGHPDVRGVLAGSHFYIELKSAPRPAKGGKVDVGLRREQRDWAERYVAAGGRNCCLLILVGTGGTGRRYLIDAEHWDTIYYDGVDEDWLAEHSLSQKDDTAEVVCRIAAEM